MVEQGRASQSWVGRIAAMIVVAVLVVGGYFALTARQEPKPGTVVDVAVVPPAPAGSPAPAATTPDATTPAATPDSTTPPTAAAPAATVPDATAVANPPAASAPQAAAPAGTTPSDSAPAVAAAPAAPAVAPDGATAAAPAAPAGATAAPSFDVVRVEPTGEAVVAGLAPPNSTVEVMDGSSAVAKGEANERGEWAMTLDKPLAPGPHDLSIRTTSADKKTETLSEQSVAVDVPENPKAGPLVVLNTPDSPSRVLQVPASAKPAGSGAATTRPDVTVDAVEFQDGTLFISGSAAIGGTVRIYVDGVVVGDADVDDNGRWQIAAKGKVGPGQHTIRVDGINKANGQVIARAEVPFEQTGDVATLMAVTTEGGGSAGASSASNVPAPNSVIIRRGDNLWTISKRLYGHGVRFSAIYEANNDQIRDPDRIYPGQVFVLPAGDARWTQ